MINNIFPISFTNNGIVDYEEFNFILGFIASLCILISFIRIIKGWKWNIMGYFMV